jgi:Holliday junction resolvase RusA-like endonuclease
MDFQSGDSILFMIPMPESWSLKKKHAMVKQPHKSKPDLDNLIKAVGDALYDDDSGLWNYRAAKRWGYEGQIIITPQL